MANTAPQVEGRARKARAPVKLDPPDPNRRSAYRPTKLTLERQNKIVAILKMGLPQIRAVEASGVARSTFQEWLAVGEHKPIGHSLRTFHDAVKAAAAVGEVARVARIEKASRTDPVWAAWLLTHSPATKDDWALKQKVEHAGNVGFSLRDLDEIENAQRANKEGPPPASTSVD